MDRLVCRTVARVIATIVCVYLWQSYPAIRATANNAAETTNVVPLPVSVENRDGSFVITPSTQVVAQDNIAAEASKLINTLAPAMGYRLKLLVSPDFIGIENSIQLRIEPSLINPLGFEGYELEVTPARRGSIMIRAAKPAGLFYGIQTLRQLLPPPIFNKEKVEGIKWFVPCVHIIDYPRFKWRGLLIDPARHFIPKQDVERFIDTMALHKFNRLQIHLTDDQGWRIEIKKYPELTQIGAWMDFSTIRQEGTGKRVDGPQRSGGFYTQDDIRQLVRYAAERYVTIVPEIEMPAHTGAAIVSYPQIGLYPRKLNALAAEKRWTVNERVLAPRPQTVAFMQDVLTEVMELFPGKCIHIGGDEANINHWKQSEEMQTLKHKLGLRDEAELHSWFIMQMDEFLTRHGRRMVGWDEIIQGGLAPGAVVMSWRGQAGGITAAQSGHDVIMAPTSHTYFDYYQGPKNTEPRAIGSFISLEKTYRFEPIPAELNTEQAQHVLGGQGQLWGEYIADRKHREYMTYPRAAALSEVLWSRRENRNYEEFVIRLSEHLKRLYVTEVNYRPLDKEPIHWQGRRDSKAPNSAGELLKRLLPEYSDRFAFEVIEPVYGRDVFEIESSNGIIVIRGNNGVAMAMGLKWYLKNYCHCHVSWNGSQLNLPNPLPQIQPKVRRISWARYRYFLNYCSFGYSLAWYDWAQWEKLIDWMALNGINMPLSVTGQEAVWQAVCKRLGMSDEQIDEFLAGPPYLPFQWMGCLDGWGGPLPQNWIDRHENLAKKILARQRELGMTPVLQGFTGHVPSPIAQRFPEANLHRIRWIEWNTSLLDPLDPLFSKIARVYMEEQAKRFGTDHLYAADTFIEMRPPSDDPKYLGDLAGAIYKGMIQSDPKAIWVLQGWLFVNNPAFLKPPQAKAMLGAIPDERMIVLDLMCEQTPTWNKTEAFYGKPWLWCNIQNFGCTVHLSGALNKISHDIQTIRRQPESGKLVGLGFVNEGLGYNPVVYDLMFEMAWRDQPVDLEQWLANYALSRYGRQNKEARRAWQILGKTVYNGPHYTRSVVDHIPHLRKVADAPYDNTQLANAWQALIAAADELGEVDTFRFDLVNVARQVLSNYANVLHRTLIEVSQKKDANAFKKASGQFLQLIDDIDELVATRKEFLLGRWLEDARRWGTTDAERALFEWNARRVLTLWGQGPAIDDYARKEWSGMLSGYYLKRWRQYLRELGESLSNNEPFNEEEFHSKLRQWMIDWSDRQEAYPTQPRGDSIQGAKRLWAKYRKRLSSQPINASD